MVTMKVVTMKDAVMLVDPPQMHKSADTAEAAAPLHRSTGQADALGKRWERDEVQKQTQLTKPMQQIAEDRTVDVEDCTLFCYLCNSITELGVTSQSASHRRKGCSSMPTLKEALS